MIRRNRWNGNKKGRRETRTTKRERKWDHERKTCVKAASTRVIPYIIWRSRTAVAVIDWIALPSGAAEQLVNAFSITTKLLYSLYKGYKGISISHVSFLVIGCQVIFWNIRVFKGAFSTMSSTPEFWDVINDSIFVWTNLNELLTFPGEINLSACF